MLRVATHNGPFHADDVLALALVRAFVDPEVRVVRTRDRAEMDAADLVFDVGGELDPARRRFDHHQNSYAGDRSSAGLLLDWMESTGQASPEAAEALRRELVDYVDAVDNGRRFPGEVPCFASLVDAYNRGCGSFVAFDAAYLRAVDAAYGYVQGVLHGVAEAADTHQAVEAAMAEATRAGRRTLYFDRSLRWKPAYYALGGAQHPTEHALMPALDGTWQVLAIAPEERSFAQKRPLPESWAGLTRDDLAAVVGVPDALFCHKNRFIAVFGTREGAIEALRRWDRGP